MSLLQPPTAASEVVSTDDARRLLEDALPGGVVTVAPSPDPAFSDCTLGMNGVLAVGEANEAVQVLFAAPPDAHTLCAVSERLGHAPLAPLLAADDQVFEETFDRARALRHRAALFAQRVLDVALYLGASDVSISVGDLPAVKVAGTNWRRLGEFLPVSPEQALQAAAWALQQPEEELPADGPFDLDTARSHRTARLRANVFRTMRQWAVSLRVLPDSVPTLETLELPPSVRGIADLRAGLVFVSGPTGSGKTTTLAALVDRINRTRHLKITTMELPVEYLHRPHRSIITAREVGADTESFSQAIDSALRQNPDVVLVGELRNPVEYMAAIRLARTGHLVLATLHAESAEEALRGVVHAFPDAEQNLVRTELAATLQAVVVQKLVPRADDPDRSTPVCEVLLRCRSISALIARDAFLQIEGELRGQRRAGMWDLDGALAQAVLDGRITLPSAREAARHPKDFDQRLREAGR